MVNNKNGIMTISRSIIKLFFNYFSKLDNSLVYYFYAQDSDLDKTKG